MGLLISSQTGAAVSDLFRIESGKVRGFYAKGLAGAEVATLEALLSDGTFAQVAVMNVASPFLSFSTIGWYRVNKPVTVGAAFVDSL